MTSVIIEEEKTQETHRDEGCDDRVRHRSDTTTCQGMARFPGVTSN